MTDTSCDISSFLSIERMCAQITLCVAIAMESGAQSYHHSGRGQCVMPGQAIGREHSR
jgi:hypothetical protein